LAGFSFEAGGRTFRPVVYHFMSGTLMPSISVFFSFFWTEASDELLVLTLMNRKVKADKDYNLSYLMFFLKIN